MAKSYRGTGGSKPERTGGGGGGGYRVRGIRLFETVKDDHGDPTDKKISDLKLDKGEKNRPIVVLDKDLDYAVRIHKGFRFDGTWQNIVVCRSALDDRQGCPLCDVLDRRFGWYLVGTVIDMGTWSPTKGKNAGKVYRNFRRLLLVPEAAAEVFEAKGEELDGGWRGARFKVTRSTKDKSLRIGDDWSYDYKKGHMSEQEMMDEFEDRAAQYGLSVEAFCNPMDYDEVLKPKPYEELKKLADAIGGESEESSRPSAMATSGKGDEEEEAIPF